MPFLRLLLSLSFALIPAPLLAQAFPGAVGWAAGTPGGRGGAIVRVTNLNANGPGSLRAALERQGPRIVVFEVGGVIDLGLQTITIDEPFLTIAGQTAPSPGITLIRTGGHFTGSSVLHWADGAEGRGVLMTGDSIMVVPDTRWVSFMYSYPNLIPTNAKTVERIVKAVKPFAYDRIYSGWWDRVLVEDAKAAVQRSADRYIAAIR